MKTLQTGTKVLIEATVLNSTEMYTLAKTRSSEIAVLTSDLTVCETEEEIDPNNWQVKMSDPDFEKVGEALKFGHDKWKNSKENACKNVGRDKGLNLGSSYFNIPNNIDTPTITGQQALKLLGVEPQPSNQSGTPSFKAGQEVPKHGDKIMVGKKTGTYCCPDPVVKDWHIVVMDEESKFLSLALGDIRPIPAQPTVEMELERVLAIVYDKSMRPEWDKGKTVSFYMGVVRDIINRHDSEHQKHSGRVAVSVPSDEDKQEMYNAVHEAVMKERIEVGIRLKKEGLSKNEIDTHFSKACHNAADMAVQKLIHFMTRKEAK